MNQLTKNIPSTEVAEMVGRDHNEVLKDVRRIINQLGEGNLPQSYFVESTYRNNQNKELPCFLFTKKGCELYGTRMTGEKGTQFAVKYINRFNEMEEHIQQQLPGDPVELALQTSLKNYQEIKSIKGDVEYLKDHMRIDGSQEFALNSQGKAKVFEVLGGYDSYAYNAVGRKVFAELWRDFKRHFKLPRYSELPKTKFNDAVYFISKWRPSTSLEIEIESYNKQTQLKLVK
ncbi:Rha family transcriptional regulator [Lysinibacillus sp. NPDC097162]|uniref:Rha family transcriptional regulator n=1 Tax=Lysinibacillus sp. NPDC097162 TaxID=3364140 RepID=UPI0037F362D5